MRTVWAGLASALAVCVLSGCGGGGDTPAVASAGGVVTLKGAPVEGARVMFHPTAGGARTSYGTTDASGKFKMSTFGVNDGALLGHHKVTIVKAEIATEKMSQADIEAMKQRGTSAMPGYDQMMGPGGAKESAKPKMLIPDTYADKDKTTLEADVAADGPNEFTFNHGMNSR